MALHVGRHLHGDPGSIMKVLQHVLALGVFDGPAESLLQGEVAGAAIRVVNRGTFSPNCGDNNEVKHLRIKFKLS